jgi:hypothetical protein
MVDPSPGVVGTSDRMLRNAQPLLVNQVAEAASRLTIARLWIGELFIESGDRALADTRPPKLTSLKIGPSETL